MIDFYRFKKFSDTATCRHAVTMKTSLASYSLSVALHTGEDRSSIVSNRKKIIAELGWKDTLHFVIANQTHSDNITIIDKTKSYGWESLEDAVEDCDALITDQKDVVLSILTADCVPILLLDTHKEVIAAVHAGWKGTSTNIVAKTVAKMVEHFGCSPSHIMAGIAPSIGGCCYEVGKEVAEHFFDTPSGYTQKGQKYMLDLPYINKHQLLSAGVLESNIEMSDVCTACEVQRFFSYRKEGGCSGRFMSMIVLTQHYLLLHYCADVKLYTH